MEKYRDNEDKSNAIIWGTRIFGDLAYLYYKNKLNVICYIDNDSSRWGEKLHGLEICTPDILREMDVTVILALRHGIEDVEKELHDKYNINEYVVFQIEEISHTEKDDFAPLQEIPKNTCIVAFGGGLGNQMFQYALYRNLEILGKNTMADLAAYSHIGLMPFQLTEVFEQIEINTCTTHQIDEIIRKNIENQYKGEKFILYNESMEYWIKKKADLSLLDISGGVIKGMHQTHCFADRIRDILLQDFRFDVRKEEKLYEIYKSIKAENSISVHVRRGDYLFRENKIFYGDICNAGYYCGAIGYIKQKIEHCKFYFFSDDIAWVKENYHEDNAVYVADDMFDDYQDWYDMCLMSACKHNIIANSTFSWWGAWLNQHKDKIVIAPRKWVNIYDYEDIYPEGWVCM